MKRENGLLFRLFTSVSKSSLIPHKVRIFLLRLAGISLGSNVTIGSGVEFKSARVSVGGGSLVNRNCRFYTSEVESGEGTVTIGCKVHIGPDVRFVCFSHEIGEPQERAGTTFAKDIIIGDGCWLGCGCIILPGVNIGKGCVIGAGALVNRDVEDNCVYAGVPAKIIRRL